MLAGDCAVTYESDEIVEKRGAVIVLVKPDDTVLVHDYAGYQPTAWLTRADTVRFKHDDRGFRLVAGKGEETLRVVSHTVYGRAHFPASPARPEVGDCPDCERPLAVERSGGLRANCDCGRSHVIPTGVVAGECDCGLPVFETPDGKRCLDTACPDGP